MAPKQSAGLLVYRERPSGLEVLLVHPGGPFWARRDEGAWSIPKGEFLDDEDPFLAAVREFEEETGWSTDQLGIELEPVKQKGGTKIFAWAVRGDYDPATLRSNNFTMEWPPKSGRQQEFPEVDRAEWFPVDIARTKLNEGQLPLLLELVGQQGS
jgi:predicted NUDIX family NTP pyrophosphohydrolase